MCEYCRGMADLILLSSELTEGNANQIKTFGLVVDISFSKMNYLIFIGPDTQSDTSFF